MPFLVDSTTMELGGAGAGIHLLIHPVMRVRRDAAGELVEVLAADAPAEEGELAESFIHVEIDRRSRGRRSSSGCASGCSTSCARCRQPSRTGPRCGARRTS